MAAIRTKDIFKKMILYILEGYDITLADKEEVKGKFNVNYEERDSEESKIYLNWRNRGEILAGENISYDFKYSVLFLDGIYYIVIEDYINILKCDFLDEVELNLGMVMLLFKEDKYYPKLNSNLQEDEIIDIIDIIDEKYICHEFSRIKNLFSDLRVFKVSEECPFKFEEDELKDTIDRILALIIIEKHKNRRFGYFNEDTLEKYEDVIKTDIKYFPYENILMSLLENKANKVFLEIYRTIEKLYPYAMIHKFKNKIERDSKDKVDLDILLLEEALTTINWRHKEEDSIKLLFDQLSINEPDDLKNIKGADRELNLAVWIYRIRNTMVHLSLKDVKKNVNVKLALESDYIINFIIPKLPILYRNCFGDK